jgi:hypothetical protein
VDFGIFIAAFGLSACASLAALLRSGKPLHRLSVTISVLNSGFLGLGFSLLWYTSFQENIYALLGVCVLSGLGGMTTVEFAMKVFRNGGFNISFGKRETDDTPGPGQEPQ